MPRDIYSKILRKFFYSGLVLLAIVLIGTFGYRFLGGQHYSLLDCLYMTIITILTIGYGEIVDLSNNPAGRVFTMFIAISGISIATYILSNVTAFMVEGEMSEAFRRRKMEQVIKKLKDHYIVCGAGGVGFHVLTELFETKRPYVLVDADREHVDKVAEKYKDVLFVEGDATDSDTLIAAGIKEACGLFAITGDDNKNLVISLTAKQLNPALRVVARCHDLKNMDKMKKAGADAVVSPTLIGGMRMASEMIRSTVVSFLDIMLRDKEKKLRIEEISARGSCVGKPVSGLSLSEYRNSLLLAIRTKNDWIYNPSSEYILKPGDTFIFLTTPDEREHLEKMCDSL